MQFLNVSENCLKDFTGIEQCILLTELHAHQNRITTLKSLNTLKNLLLADFTHNQIPTLKEISYLMNNQDLQYLSLLHNPIITTQKYMKKLKFILPNL